MEPVNQTQVSEFLFLGFSEKPEQEIPLLGVFFCLDIVTMVGNILIILAIGSDCHLHTPTYFFLSNLSFVDLGLVLTTVPKMLEDILTHSKAIPYAGCLAQMYFFIVFTCMDNFLLGVMAYDRFVAICHRLHYVSMMSPQLCLVLVLSSWIVSLLNFLTHIMMTTQLSFCKDHDIPHFFCNLSQVLKMSCSDTFISNIFVYFTLILLAFIPLTVIIFSYSKICASILRIPSHRGKHKAFSTCGSHLCVVSLFYGTIHGLYLSYSTAYSSWKSSITSAMYTVVTPMLNPFIYSLRNKDMKNVLRRLFSNPTSSECWGVVSILGICYY